MTKAALYVSARAPGRVPKAILERAIEVFQSTGEFAGPTSDVAEIANWCLEKRITFTLGILVSTRDSGDTYKITRTR